MQNFVQVGKAGKAVKPLVLKGKGVGPTTQVTMLQDGRVEDATLEKCLWEHPA